jgi:hypothetical protein
LESEDIAMSYNQEMSDGSTGNMRRQRRQQEDRKRMGYRRAIEQYRESQALHALVCDFPELTESRYTGLWLR